MVGQHHSAPARAFGPVIGALHIIGLLFHRFKKALCLVKEGYSVAVECPHPIFERAVLGPIRPFLGAIRR